MIGQNCRVYTTNRRFYMIPVDEASDTINDIVAKVLKHTEQKSEKQAKKSTFKRWTQFNNEHTRELMWLAMNHPTAQVVLYFLVEHMDNYNAVICSFKVMEEVLKMSSRTIMRAIKVLKERGFIAVLKSGTSNVYAVNDKIYWKSWGKNQQYSKFPANVILALSEQDIAYQQKIMAEKLKEVVVPEEPKGVTVEESPETIEPAP